MQLNRNILLSLLTLVPNVVNGMLPIHVKNYRFIKPASPDNNPEENEVFFVKGIDYQPGGSSGYDGKKMSDVLDDPDICARDALVFQQLGINTIRIYTLNPDVNHDKCMTILNDAGIYVILDVNSGNDGENLNRANPSGSYNAQYLKRVFKMIEAFKNYPNVLGFFSGNEVINDENNYAGIDPPYIRAVQRDMKQYIAKHSNRTIPVGYSAADNTDLRLATFKYLQCNSLDGKTIHKSLNESRSDFFGLNTYEWCSGTSDWTSSGYDKLNSTFSDAVIPLIFSEYGCNKNLPRTFDEVTDGLYPAKGLGNVFSGGLVYEYAEEANHYGLVEIDKSDDSITYKTDFTNLKKRFDDVSIINATESSLNNNTLYKCDASAITDAYSEFGVNNFTIPSQPYDITKLIEKGVNATNIGQILTNYTVPNTVKFDITDSDGNAVSTEIKYDEKNMENHLKAETASASAISSSTTASSSTSTTATSTLSTTAESSTVSSSSSAKSSKNIAVAAEIPTGLLGSGLLAGLISIIL